ncbi:hypothetical protein [Halorubrum sp. DTA98]|uniref:hypothetical protein n=1 Tax=Halorubrum sp. DTA98 TaxID=3402163 RepID=UPI003AAAEB0A
MQTVDVSYTVDLPAEDLRAQLTPEAIIECADVYVIESVETVGEAVEVTTSFRNEELVFSFREIDDGYEYTMVAGENLFAERASRIVVTDLEETRITAETRFTLDTWLSVVLDRLAKRTVRKELDNVVVHLVERAMDDDGDGDLDDRLGSGPDDRIDDAEA